MKSNLSQEIRQSSDLLVIVVNSIPTTQRILKVMEGTGGKVSITDLIAYRIGWGNCLIRWYETGIKGEQPEMPGQGFTKWDYVGIAKHFYQKYTYDASTQQIKVFEETVDLILEITKKEQHTGNLDQEGIWSWCTLSSGKKWPLSKWIRVNTVSPYKRAVQLIKKAELMKTSKNL